MAAGKEYMKKRDVIKYYTIMNMTKTREQHTEINVISYVLDQDIVKSINQSIKYGPTS